MHFRSLAVAALAGATLFSCNKENTPRPTIEPIVPLQVGNQWQYRVYLYDWQGTLYDSTGTYTRTVLRDTTINQSTWYILNNGSIVQNTANGYAYYNNAGKSTLLIYPGQEQGGVGYNYLYPNYNLWVYTVPNHAATPVPNSRQKFVGNLYSVEYTFNYTNPVSTHTQKREDWVVPAVGPVRWDTYYRDSNVLQQRLELISYTLK